MPGRRRAAVPTAENVRDRIERQYRAAIAGLETIRAFLGDDLVRIVADNLCAALASWEDDGGAVEVKDAG